jgi:large conductance mechanosensitive channel
VNLDGDYTTVAAAETAGAPIIKYGVFINTVLDFVIVAFAIFLVIKALNKLRRQQAAQPAAPPAPSTQEKLLMEIRDALKAQSAR